MKVKYWFAAVVLAAVPLLSAADGNAATVYVDAGNTSGVESGTLDSPFNTIQEGIDHAVPGDTVSVAPGIYYGAIEMKNLVPLISQKGPKNTIIDGMGAMFVVNSPYSLSASSVIEGFTIRNGYLLINATNRVSFWYSTSWSVTNCILQDGAIAVESMPSAAVRITKSVITNISIRAIDAIWCPPPQFTNVTINNVPSAFFIYQIGLQVNNTTVTNVTNVVELWGHYGSGSVWGSNNNFWNYTNFSGPTWEERYPSLNLANSIQADPLFVNAPTDYSLQAGSPLIDAGMNVGLPFYGAAPDIGAYEHAPQSVPELVAALAESYQQVPAPAFKNAAEQRLNALQNKFTAVLQLLNNVKADMAPQAKKGILSAALTKLTNDVWAKGDGFYGGNPNDDWITTREEQDALYPRVMEVKTAIEQELQLL